MHRSHRASRSGRTLPTVAAAVISLAAILTLLACLAYLASRPAEPEESDRAMASRGSGPEGPDGPPAPLSGAPPPEGHESEGAGSAPASDDALAGDATGATARREIRVTGRVTSSSEPSVAAARVVWAPSSSADLLRRIHDGSLTLPGVDAAGGPDRAADCDADGAYELSLPGLRGLPGETGPGILVASAEGHVPSWRELGPLLEAATPDGEEVDDLTGKRAVPASLAVDFVLEPGGAIRGRVLDADTEEPAPGVVVQAGVLASDGPAFTEFVPLDAPRAVADERGDYALTGLAPGEYRVVARPGKTDYAPTETKNAPRAVIEAGMERGGLDLRVSRGARILVMVDDALGDPVEEATCALLPANLIEASMAGGFEYGRLEEGRPRPTDADGRQEFRGVRRGAAYRVSVDRAGFASATSPLVRVGSDATEVEVDVTLARGFSVSGFVVDEQGQPVAGVPVMVVPDLGALMRGDVAPTALARLRVESDEQGAFTLSDLSPGEVRLVAGQPNPQELLAGSLETTRVDLDGTGDVTDVEVLFRQTRGARITGRVVDDLGRPVASASVTTMASAGGMGTSISSQQSSSTDEMGRFDVDAPGGSAALRVRASAPLHATARELVSDQSTEVVLVLPRFGRIRGSVRTTSGAAIGPGARVRASPEEPPSMLERLTSGDGDEASAGLRPDATFEVPAPPGRVVVVVDAPGYAPGRSEVLTLQPGGEANGVEVRLSAGATLRGSVTLVDGQPVAGAVVRIRPETSSAEDDLLIRMLPDMFGDGRHRFVTDEAGSFEAAGLAPARYSVRAEHSGYPPSAPAEVSLREGQDWKLRPLVLLEGGVISGRVLDGDEPAAGFMIQAVGGSGNLRPTTTSADGRFRIQGLDSGEYVLNTMDMSGMSQGKLRLRRHVVDVRAGEIHDVTIRYGTGHRIHGKVSGMPEATGGPRMVLLRRPGGPAPEDQDPLGVESSVEAGKYQAGFGMIAPDSTWEIADVEPGEYILEIPRLPENPTDPGAYEGLDRTPLFRRDVTVRERDLKIDIEIE